MNIVSRALIILFLVYIGLGVYLYVVQRSLIYFPVAETPTQSKSKNFSNEGHNIRVYVLNENSTKAMIYFGGNAENVENNASQFAEMFPDYAVHLVNYRGYGGSSGSPTENGIYSDALAIYDGIQRNYESIAVIGRSLGSAVATHLASHRPIDKLALVTPFDSVQNVAQAQFPIYPMSLLLKDKHDSYTRAQNVKAKTLIIAAELDRVIKMPHTLRLVKAFDSDVEFHVLNGVGHNTISSSRNYHEILRKFM